VTHHRVEWLRLLLSLGGGVVVQVQSTMVEKKVGDVVNRLNRTREEKFPDLRAQREERDAKERQELRKRQEEEVRGNGGVGELFSFTLRTINLRTFL